MQTNYSECERNSLVVSHEQWVFCRERSRPFPTEKNKSLEKYFRRPLGLPSKDWMKKWFQHWLRIYGFGVEDFKRSKKRKFDEVSDSLPRGVVNFGILFLETRGYIPTTKGDVQKYFLKEIDDEKTRAGFKIALKAHHQDRNISLPEAGQVYLCGEFLKKTLSSVVLPTDLYL